MKMTLISVTSSWLFATGVAVIASYCILTHSDGTAAGQKKAAQVAARISARGTAPKYKSTNRHSSAVKKTTRAKVVKEIKIPKYVPNPLYTPFTNALNNMTKELAEIAKHGNVKFAKGFALVKKGSNPMTAGVYSLSGTQLRQTNDLEGLPAGLYIVGGKKTVIK